MTNKTRLEMQAEIDYYKRAAQIATNRLFKERTEHTTRLRDRAFIIALIIAIGILVLLTIYGLANFSRWAAYGY